MSTEQQVEQHILATPPRCLQGFRVRASQLPTPFDDNVTSVWQAVCQCGHERGRLLGYPLSTVASDYNGRECFVGPLAFECSTCSATTEVLDTDQHGYHAEVARLEGDDSDGTKYSGTGTRQAWRCPNCAADVFSMTFGFVFWNLDYLAEFSINWNDFFNVFLCYCHCQKCGHVSEPTEFGKL